MYLMDLREKSSPRKNLLLSRSDEKNRSGPPKREDSFWGELFVSWFDKEIK